MTPNNAHARTPNVGSIETRAEADRRARRSNELAGLYLTPYAEALRKEVVNGTMTEAEYRAVIIAEVAR